MKKISLIISILLFIFLGSNVANSNHRNTQYNDSYNNYSSYSNDRSCKSGRYGPYSYPRIQNGRSYTSYNLSNSAIIRCNNGYISVKNIRNESHYNNHKDYNHYDRGSCAAGRYGSHSFPRLEDRETYTSYKGDTTVILICKNGYVSIKSSITNPTDIYSNESDGSCNAGRYGSHTFPRLTNGETYTSVVGNTTAILVCKNGYVSIKSSNTTPGMVYDIDRSGFCNAGKYVSHTFPALGNGETFESKKYINDGKIVTTLQCKNGYVSILSSITVCNSGFDSYGKNCNRKETFNKSCYAGNYGGYHHPNMRHGGIYTVKKRLNRRYVYKVLRCNNGRVSLRNTYGSYNRYGNRNRNGNRYGYNNYGNYNRYGGDYRITLPLPPLPPLPFIHF